jgi:hypothetical protein
MTIHTQDVPSQTEVSVATVETLTVSQLIELVGEFKDNANHLYKQYKALKDEEDLLKSQLFTALKGTGLKSAKGETYTASIAETPSVVIQDEAALLEWLQNTPNVESDFYIGVKKPEFNTLAKQMLKETGEMANGTEIQIRESISIRANKK